MANFGTVMSPEEALDLQNFQRPSNPIAMPEMEDSKILAEQANADKPQLGDPATAWFETGPYTSDPLYKDAEDDFERVLAQAYNASKPRNLQEWISMGDMLVQTNPGMTSFIKRRMQDMPMGTIKDEYDAKMQDAKMKRDISKEIEMAIFRKKALKAAGVPDKDDAKADADKRKSIVTQIKDANSLLEADGISEQRQRLTEARIEQLYSQLDEMDGISLDNLPPEPPPEPGMFEKFTTALGNKMTPLREPEPVTPLPEPISGPQQITDKAQYDRLPSGSEYIGPDGKLRRKK